ncbi:MAG TPA: hypothetical protein EYP86_03100 [Candidatus Altiarchaeales archaeon]|nr:hypothetical protein [Candidatus Altiarchaeales archaeon]
MKSEIFKALLFLIIIFILSYFTFSLIFDAIHSWMTETRMATSTSTILMSTTMIITTSSTIASTTTTPVTTTSTISTNISTTTTSTTSSSTTTTIAEFTLDRLGPVTYSGYRLLLKNIISTDRGDKYLIEIETPDGSKDELEIYDKFVIDGIEFGVLERQKGFRVKFYATEYHLITSIAPEHSVILSVGGKNFFSFERTFMDYKFRLHSRRLYVSDPRGREIHRDIPDNGSIRVDDLEIGILQHYSPGGYTTIYIKSTYRLRISDQTRGASYNNIHTTLGISTKIVESLENPIHGMREKSGQFIYSVDTGYIPMQNIYENGKLVDLEWRGKIWFAGEEFYVMDIENETLYLSKGATMYIHNLGFSPQFFGYEYKVDKIYYNEEGTPFAVSLIVRNPEGREYNIDLYPNQILSLDNKIRLQAISVNEDGHIQGATLFVYNFYPLLVLENNKSMTYKPEWLVRFGIVEQPFDYDMNITEYRKIDHGQKLLKNITIVRCGEL